MPLPIITPSVTQPAPKPPEPIIAKPEHQSTIVDTRYESTSSLMVNVEGSPWTVDWVSQVLDKDSPLSGQQVNQAALYQQYSLIKEFELRVTQPLSTSQDAATKQMVVTGAANVFLIIPNNGDMFFADIGDGREGIFKITHSERKSYLKGAVYAVEYQLIDYASPVRKADINSKIIKTRYFVKNFMQYGQDPLLEEEDYHIIQELEGRLHEMTQRYFKLFTSSEFRTLIVPGQQHYVYDAFLTNAIMSFFTTYDAPEIRYIRKLNVQEDHLMKSPTIWDVVRDRDLSLLKFCNRKVGLMSTRSFHKNPMMDGIYHSGIHYVVYPKDPEYGVDYEMHGKEKALSGEVLQPTPSRVRRLADLVGDKEFDGLTLPDCPPIYKVAFDDHYVLSSHFYNDTTKQSILERCVRDYLENKAPNLRALRALCATYHGWGGLERFYYIPLLLMLIKATIRSF